MMTFADSRRLVGIAGGLGLLAAQAYAQSSTPTGVALAIEHVNVLPMNADTLMRDHTVLIAGGRIVWLGPAGRAIVPTSARRVDGRGKFLMPGLSDMHVHLAGVGELGEYLANGVTTVVNMNGRPIHLVWRNRISRGTLAGPRVFSAGTAIGRGSDETHVQVNTPEDATALVRQQRAAGYDMIKVQSAVTLPVFQQLLAAARAEELPVVGHVMEGIGSSRAVAAGQVTLEHINTHMFGGDMAKLDEGATALARAGVFAGSVLSSRDGSCGPPSESQRQMVAALLRAKVKVLAGTDASLGPLKAGASLHCELRTLVAAGMSPYEALSSATFNAGAFIRTVLRDSVPSGVVRVGARADLLMLHADPRVSLSALAQPVGIVLLGQWRPR